MYFSFQRDDIINCFTRFHAIFRYLNEFIKKFVYLFVYFFSGISSSWLWTSISAQMDCAPSAMSKCTDPLKVVTDNKDLGFATSKEELVKMCP